MSVQRGLTLHLLLLLLLAENSKAWPFWPTEPEVPSNNASCDLQGCAILDMIQLQDHIISLNGSLTWNETEYNESVPFGALPSDWSRLWLLQERQPNGTVLRENLLRLSRIILAAYFAQQDKTESTTAYDKGSEITTSFQTVAPVTADERPARNLAVDRTDEGAGSLFTDNAPKSTEIVSGTNNNASAENEAVHERSKEEDWKPSTGDDDHLSIDLLANHTEKSSEDFFARESNETETTTLLEVEKVTTWSTNLTSSVEDQEASTPSVNEDLFAEESTEGSPESTTLDLLAQESEKTVKKPSQTRSVTAKNEVQSSTTSVGVESTTNQTEDLLTSTLGIEEPSETEKNSSSEDKTTLTRSLENQNNETTVASSVDDVGYTVNGTEEFENSTALEAEEGSSTSGILTESAENFFKLKEDEAVERAYEARSIELKNSTTPGSFMTADTEDPTSASYENETETTDQDLPLGVAMNGELLPTPQSSIMRKVLMTFYRDANATNELQEEESREYDQEVPMDAALLESAENLREDPGLNQPGGARTIEQQRIRRKRPGAILEAGVSRQYQTLSGEQTPAEKRPDNPGSDERKT